MCEMLENVIPKGKSNAIHLNELMRRLGTTESVARSLVRTARKNGAQILSGSCGYWFADSDREKREYIAGKRKCAFSYLKGVKPISVTLDDIEEQMHLELKV